MKHKLLAIGGIVAVVLLVLVAQKKGWLAKIPGVGSFFA